MRFGGVHDRGRKSRLQATERRSKPGRSSANDNDIRLIQLTHASPLFCPTTQIYIIPGKYLVLKHVNATGLDAEPAPA